MPISSLILRFDPARRDRFVKELSGIEGITLLKEIEGAVAVLLEADDRGQEWHRAQQLPRLPGCRGVDILVHVPEEEEVTEDQSAVPAKCMLKERHTS